MFLKDTTIKIPTSDRIIRTNNKIIKTTVINNDNDDKDSLHNNNFDNINKKIVMIIIMSIIITYLIYMIVIWIKKQTVKYQLQKDELLWHYDHSNLLFIFSLKKLIFI